MSLIGDALRKARKEAAERETDRRGVLFSAKINDSPTRSGLGLGIALGAVIAVAATVAGGGAVWWLLAGGQAQEPALQTSTSAADVAAGSAIPTPVPSPDPVGAENRKPTEVAAAPTATAASGAGSHETTRSEPPPDSTVEPTPEAATAGDGPDGGFVGIEDGDEVYVMEADLGSVHLGLDYIIYRHEDPFVEINGIELHIGGVVDGFRVKTIERDRVTLSDGRRTIVLRAP